MQYPHSHSHNYTLEKLASKRTVVAIDLGVGGVCVCIDFCRFNSLSFGWHFLFAALHLNSSTFCGKPIFFVDFIGLSHMRVLQLREISRHSQHSSGRGTNKE